ncbi:MAG TPA: cation:proton antiporter [Gemmatimonadaceae bacterium]|nr:cation:proton antiporter [Gemmatimonadaceae bacterium]
MTRKLALLFLLGIPMLLGAGQAEHVEVAAEAISAEHFFFVLIAVLVSAKLLGELAERIGQPAVLGELVAGVLLGATALGVLPASGPLAEVIELLKEIGVTILLFEIGLETDLKELFRVGGSAATVALVGVAAPFILGYVYWIVATPAIGVHAPGITDQMVAIFVGATLTATSVGITARVLNDIGRLHTRESRVIIGAAVVDDVLGLVILAVVSGLAAGAAFSLFGVARTFAVAVGFLIVAVMVGNRLAPRLFGLIDQMGVRGVLLVSAFSFALLFAALAAVVGSAMIIGSFAAGLVLSTTNQFDMITDRIKPVADIFTPIFFVVVGAGVDVTLFMPWHPNFNVPVLVVGGILVAIGLFGKVIAGYAVGWRAPKLNHLAIGVGMVPRGEVGLIFAEIGRSRGILSSEVFSAILIMVIFTTFLVPPLLKPIFERTAEPQDREPPVADATEAD